MKQSETNFGDKVHELTKADKAKGARAANKARKEKKLIKDYLTMLLESDMGNDKDGKPISGAEAMAIRAVNSALKGDWKAWELVRDTVGQKPADKQEITTSDINITIGDIKK